MTSMMKTCWSVGRVRGVRIDLHASLLLMPVCLAYLLRPENRLAWRDVVAGTVAWGLSLLGHEATAG